MNHDQPTDGGIPRIIPALQGRDIISVTLGDYFKAALTASGKLLTWGSFSRGALGLGHPRDLPVGAPGGPRTEQQRNALLSGGPSGTPPDVEVPREVRFDWGRRRPKEHFCFLAAAAGWHMGALVIDLEVRYSCALCVCFKCLTNTWKPDQPDDSDDEHVNMPGAYRPAQEEPDPPMPRPLRGHGPPLQRAPRGIGATPWRIGLAGAPALGRGRGGPGDAARQPPDVPHGDA
jgi:SCF-associated factor 1